MTWLLFHLPSPTLSRVGRRSSLRQDDDDHFYSCCRSCCCSPAPLPSLSYHVCLLYWRSVHSLYGNRATVVVGLEMDCSQACSTGTLAAVRRSSPWNHGQESRWLYCTARMLQHHYYLYYNKGAFQIGSFRGIHGGLDGSRGKASRGGLQVYGHVVSSLQGDCSRL